MTVAHPMTGRDANGQFQMSGRAAVPGLYSGAGFNWNSMVQINGWRRPGMNGFGRTVRRGRGWAGLGTNGDGNIVPTGVDTSALFPTGTAPDIFGSSASAGTSTLDLSLYPTLATGSPNTVPIVSTATTAAAQGASGQVPWYASVLSSLAKTGSNIASYQLNPLYQKSTYYQTPQGLVYASNQPTSGIPGLTTTQVSSMMPILLIGGVLVVVMMMARR